MPRGTLYTRDEDSALLMLMSDMRNDNTKCTYTEIAMRAFAYGICKGRNISAIAQHLSLLDGATSQAETNEAEEEQVEAEEILNRKEAALYRSIRNTFFDTATLGENNGGMFLNINIPEIRRWFKEHEPEAFNSCLECLKNRKKAGER